MDALVVGAACTRFGMQLERSLRDLAGEAADAALADAGVEAAEIGLVIFANAAAGLITGQEMIRAQTALSTSLVSGRPMLSVENACASSSSAFHLASNLVSGGYADFVMVVGAEKMTADDRTLAGRALATAIDVDRAARAPEGRPDGASRPVFMEIYAASARAYMAASGATAEDFARVASKNTRNGAANPIAQVRTPLSVSDVLEARVIAAPLTRPMCSSIGDGAAALVLCSRATAKRRGLSGPRVLASALGSGNEHSAGKVVEDTARRAYEQAGVSPNDISVVELHDAAAPAELEIPEELGLVAVGDGLALLRHGMTEVGGRLPINPSGGLLARGHPIGATGAAQIVEIVDQLRGRAGERQISNPRLGLAENAGGSMGDDPAACVVTILEAP